MSLLLTLSLELSVSPTLHVRSGHFDGTGSSTSFRTYPHSYFQALRSFFGSLSSDFGPRTDLKSSSWNQSCMIPWRNFLSLREDKHFLDSNAGPRSRRNSGFSEDPTTCRKLRQCALPCVTGNCVYRAGRDKRCQDPVPFPFGSHAIDKERHHEISAHLVWYQQRQHS
jgi:hypothetical protein